ncbi:MAG TPA: biotin/lipoyl-containing protein [Candidatus Sulfomarinibacteraceae bacterium]|nr:biotin/lipoyl-containing protein [Candidatus Sulfomarinibacteraceae bacterium]
MKYVTTVNDKEYIIEIDQENEITVNGQKRQVDFQQLSNGGALSLIIDHQSLEAIVDEREDAWEVLLHGELYTVRVQDERSYRLAQARGQLSEDRDTVIIRSPMPGLILNVLVEEGDSVNKGQTVVILESMKMENELRAARDGQIARVHVEKGASVEKNQDLVTIGDSEDIE